MAKDSCSEAYKHQPIKPMPIWANKKAIKIKYNSSPVTVIARDASEFRAMVQNLTGKDSGTSGICTTRKQGNVEDFSHGTTTAHPQSDIALHDKMPLSNVLWRQ